MPFYYFELLHTHRSSNSISKTDRYHLLKDPKWDTENLILIFYTIGKFYELPYDTKTLCEDVQGLAPAKREYVNAEKIVALSKRAFCGYIGAIVVYGIICAMWKRLLSEI